MSKLTISFFVVLGFLVLFPQHIQAKQVREIAYENVNPVDRGEYAIKRLGEKFKLFYLGVAPQKKAQFYHKLVNRRFKELAFVVENKDIGQIQKSSERYFTAVGEMVEFLNSREWPVREEAKNTLAEQIEVLPSFIEQYTGNSAEWLLLKQDLEYAQIYRGRL